MKPPFYSNVSSKYGAPMGRPSTPFREGAEVHVTRVPFVDGDYDPGGAYWGGGAGVAPIYCAWADDDTAGGPVYVRARTLVEAKRLVKEQQNGNGHTLTVKRDTIDLDAFLIGYIEAALWSTTDESDESGGEPLDANYDSSNIEYDTRQDMIGDCTAFVTANLADLVGVESLAAGRDFWLSRNGHGTGFLDRDLGDVGDRLHASAKKLGEVYLYVGDDGKIYGS